MSDGHILLLFALVIGLPVLLGFLVATYSLNDLNDLNETETAEKEDSS